MGSISGLNHPVHIVDDAITMLGHTKRRRLHDRCWPVARRERLRLEVLTHGDLPHRGPDEARPHLEH